MKPIKTNFKIANTYKKDPATNPKQPKNITSIGTSPFHAPDQVIKPTPSSFSKNQNNLFEYWNKSSHPNESQSQFEINSQILFKDITEEDSQNNIKDQSAFQNYRNSIYVSENEDFVKEDLGNKIKRANAPKNESLGEEIKYFNNMTKWQDFFSFGLNNFDPKSESKIWQRENLIDAGKEVNENYNKNNFSGLLMVDHLKSNFDKSK